MLFPTLCLALLLGACSAQLHGEICHSNIQQRTEDQVIVIVVDAIDADDDGIVANQEILVFFAELIGVELGELVHILGDMSVEDLLRIAAGLRIEKNVFVQAWHGYFHDSVDFVEGTFDVFDTNRDRSLDVFELENVVNIALETGDINRDRKLEGSELVIFLEGLYKHCDD